MPDDEGAWLRLQHARGQRVLAAAIGTVAMAAKPIGHAAALGLGCTQEQETIEHGAFQLRPSCAAGCQASRRARPEEKRHFAKECRKQSNARRRRLQAADRGRIGVWVHQDIGIRQRRGWSRQQFEIASARLALDAQTLWWLGLGEGKRPLCHFDKPGRGRTTMHDHTITLESADLVRDLIREGTASVARAQNVEPVVAVRPEARFRRFRHKPDC